MTVLDFWGFSVMISKNLSKVLISTLGLLVVGCSGASSDIAEDGLKPHYYDDLQPQRCCTIIAHAGFELDFDLTSDGHWVAAHDWPNWKIQTGYTGQLPPTRADFMSTLRKYKKISWSIEGEYNAVDMAWIDRFLKRHSDAFIVTDMKELEQFSDFVDAILNSPKQDQFIFQAYSIDDVELIKNRAPDAKIILTLYRIGYPAELFTNLKEKREDLMGVTVPMSWAYVDSVTERLLETGLPIYLHGAPANINSRGLHADFAAKGISGFYLD